MKLIVGLGNIGKEYAQTRHNIGFMVVDELASRYNVTAWQTKWQAEVAQCFMSGKVLLVKPNTYMNLSGNAVREIVNFYNVAPEDIIVIQDDLDLSCGHIRIREKGSAGGHNGISSIIQNLSTQEFPRLKIGIGHPEQSGKKVVNHVLERFNSEEQPLIKEAIANVASAVELLVKGNDIRSVMNKYNTKKAPKPKKQKTAEQENAVQTDTINKELE